MKLIDAPPIFGIQMSPVVYILLGILVALLIVIVGLSIKIHRANKGMEPPRFEVSNNPLDEGIDQRLYKPKGTPAVIHKNAFRRIRRR